ncbi:F0F1 ATP synthase subunit B' (plasmid) [Pseudorhodobacter turbinis]|uniref:ATP synthase subunit b n=1 Tax=Pseudorhodobacter turbinis TaxID=2500533 RepID=A0A4P8EIT4_9RHOB|nr:F0F1 ATP synthase subunit B' [Pseudorhodobacter turbinis]QCO56743.1 F0F1 ATP synthase subunit B' [Pseudorhodobacter turbinis]
MATEVLDAAAAAHEAGHTAETSSGMPQLDITTWDNQIFWLLVSLVAIYLIVTRVAVPRIGAVLAERRGTITNDLAAAEELKLKANEAETAYNKALAAAREEASKIVAAARMDIEADLAKATAKADADIEAKTAVSEKRIAEIREGAMESVTEVAKDTAKELVAVLGGKADARAINAAVSARLKG